MKKQLLFTTLLAISIGFAGCSDNPSDTEQKFNLSSVYVFNEGNFSDSNGSVTSFSPLEGKAIQQAFQNVNGRPLAGIIQSAAAIDGYLYVVMNNPNKIEVMDAQSFASIATIEMETTPVSIAPAGTDGVYVTNLFSNSVSIVNTKSFEVSSKKITVGSNPQDIVAVGKWAYVANNGFGNDNTISVINTGNDTVVKTLTVGYGPTDLEVDDEGNIWAVCNGKIAYDENFNRVPENDIPGSIYVIDGNKATIIDSIKVGGHPADIALNNKRNRAYLINEGVAVINTTNFSVTGSKLTIRNFNAVGYSAAEKMIYLAQSKGYSQAGQVIRYNLEGAAVDSFAAGIAPKGFYFVKK